MNLRIFDSMSRSKRDFAPLTEGRVKMYVCGVTVYDLCHIGHARCYVAFDVIVRYLRHCGLDVTYIRNFTDVDDKIIRRANESGQTCEQLTDRFIAAFHEDMEALAVLRADVEPRVTTHIEQIVAFVQKILAAGHGYEVDGDVYFSIDSFAPYGRLSRRDLSQLICGASGRVGLNERLKNPLDFALWKRSKPGEPAWPSPWGSGRPGWHIECSTMSAEYLGETFDIHGGGQDLIFPHHENEIAQSEAAHGLAMARYWMHNGFVNCPVYLCYVDPNDPNKRYSYHEVEASESQYFLKGCQTLVKPCIVARDQIRFTEVDGQRVAWHGEQEGLELKLEPKMSKSIGNFYTVREVLERYHPQALRYFLLTTHYRAPLNFSFEALDEATNRVAYIYETLDKVDRLLATLKPQPNEAVLEEKRIRHIETSFCEAMDDDFNTPKALGALADVLHFANEIVERKSKSGKYATLLRLRNEIRPVFATLGVCDRSPSQMLDEIRDRKLLTLDWTREQIETQIRQRTEARAAKDFARADAIRDELLAHRVMLMDGPQGTAWKIS